MKKFGTPTGAAPGVANENGFDGVGVPPLAFADGGLGGVVLDVVVVVVLPPLPLFF